MALIALAVIVGGGGVVYGLANLVVQLGALAVLAINPRAVSGFIVRAPRWLTALVLATIALPLLQLVPLPPGVWPNLPGRDLVSSAFVAAGVSGWFPVSVNSARTLVAFVGLLVPFTVMAAAWGMPRRDLIRCGWLIVALGLASIGLGAIQVLSMGNAGKFYHGIPMPGVLFGTFANRNSTAIFFDCCLVLLVALPLAPRMESYAKLIRGGAGIALAIGLILTESRSGIALGLVPAMFAVARVTMRRSSTEAEEAREASGAVRGKLVLAAGVFAALAVVAVAAGPGRSLLTDSRVGTSVDRFELGDGGRSEIRDDAIYVAKRYWPVGAGMGTFDDVFQVDESLEYLSPRRAGRAHNDYLEVSIEAGLVGVALIIAWLGVTAFGCMSARRSPDRWIAWAGGMILLMVAAQSLLDYPLRNQAMLATAAYALVLLLWSGRQRQKESRP